MTSQPGEKCPIKDCDGRIVVYTTRINFVRQIRVRYMHCSCCGHLPPDNKWIIPLAYAPIRK